jgi:putative ABC transport system permease protein
MHQPGNSASGTEWWVVSPYILAETLRREAPEVVGVARVLRQETVVQSNNRPFVEKKFYFADPELLRIFNFPLIQGDARTALANPFSVVLTKTTAEKYFGPENPIGRTVTIGENQLYQVTGVMQDVPGNSHFSFDLLASFDTLYTLWQSRSDWKTNWFNNPFKTYLQLRPGYDPRVFDEKLRRYSFKGFADETYTFHVQPLTDIHFRGHYNGELEANGDAKYLFIFSGIAVFLMIIACSNFVNLSTALSSVRAKEVGVRKVVGAGRLQLIGQFLGESLLMAGAALATAAFMVAIVLPVFRRLVGSTIPLRTLIEPSSLLFAAVFVVGTGLIAGLYPAFVLSSFLPVKTLRGDRSARSGAAVSFRSLLVVVQFVISAALITGTLVVRGQLDFLRTKKLGYQRDHVLTLNVMRDPGLARNIEALKRDLKTRPRIESVSECTGFPNEIGWSNLAEWQGRDPNDKPFFYRLGVDREFLGLFGLEIVRGRAFSQTPGADESTAYIVNETAVKRMGLKDPIGQPFGFWKIDGTIIGVVKDFHFALLSVPIAPLGMSILPSRQLYRIALKISSTDIPKTIDDIQSAWRKYASFYPFQFAFLDDTLDAAYKKEQNLAEGFGYFTLIAVFIAGLGLFGLSSYSAERRTKEISIRKVLGAGIPQIVTLLARDFSRWIAVANLLAAPVAYFAMRAWLRTFAYRISVPLSAFIISTILVLAASALTVGRQLLKAATADPATSLRQE